MSKNKDISPPGTARGNYNEFKDEALVDENVARGDVARSRNLLSNPEVTGEEVQEFPGPQGFFSARNLDGKGRFEFPVDGVDEVDEADGKDLHILSFTSGAATSVGTTAKTRLTDEENAQLQQIVDVEKSHVKQWRKHLMAVFIIVVSLVVNFLRGSRKTPSIIGITKCGTLDWSIFLTFIVIALLMSYVGVRINKREQRLKEKGGATSSSDIRYRGRPLFYLLFFAFIGGWVSGAFGLGGGSVFNPLMIELGVPPTVSTSTGMYMIMFSTAASSIIYISYGALNEEFAIWLGIWSIIGIIGGIHLVDSLIKKYNRQSIIVFILCLVLGISAVLVPFFNGIEVLQQLEAGKDIWKFTSICS